jgi:purine-binding chemotaxis protein CheW
VTSSPSEPRADDVASEYLTFFVQGEEYALGLTRVREVIPFDTITRVPQLPPAIVGVTNLRGAVVPVLDLARKLFGIETEVDKRTCIVLVEVGEAAGAATIGIMTEAVGQVLALAAADIAPPPSFGAPIRVEFLRGMGKVGKKFALLLDVERLLTIDELRSSELASAPADVTGDDAAEVA